METTCWTGSLASCPALLTWPPAATALESGEHARLFGLVQLSTQWGRLQFRQAAGMSMTRVCVLRRSADPLVNGVTAAGVAAGPRDPEAKPNPVASSLNGSVLHPADDQVRVGRAKCQHLDCTVACIHYAEDCNPDTLQHTHYHLRRNHQVLPCANPWCVAGRCVAGIPGSEAGEGRGPVPAEVAARSAACGGGPGEARLQARCIAVCFSQTPGQVQRRRPSAAEACRQSIQSVLQ